MFFDKLIKPLYIQFTSVFEETFDTLFSTAVYWLPIFLLAWFISSFRTYTRLKYTQSLEWIILEIKVPKEIPKSPAAMELMLTALHQTAHGTWINRVFSGRVRAWFSLEMVSIEGSVHFFIRTQKFFKNLIETQIYAQFSGAEIYEVDDYTNDVDFGNKDSEWDLFGLEYKLAKPDPYPIRTYIDYELDKITPYEEKKIDPLTPTIELLGSLKEGEQIWIQIIVMAAADRFKAKGSWFKKQGWKEEGIELVKKLRESATTKAGEATVSFKFLSPGEDRVIKSIERGLSKIGFDTGIRALYLGKGNSFSPISFVSMIGTFKQFNSEDMNGFKPNWKFGTNFDYPWQDLGNVRMGARKRKLINAYRARSYFHAPHKRFPFVLSVEELATIFHFPGEAVETPTFQRIASKTGEPPVNLPI